MPWKHLIWIGLLALAPMAWSAGGHYPVDDAAITEPGHFQVDGWYTRIGTNESEFALVSSWTPSGTSLELTAGLYRLDDDQGSRSRFEPAAKWQFSAIEPGRIAIAASIDFGYEDNRWADWLLNVPISYQLPVAPVIVHANAGWMHDRTDGGTDHAFLGAAFEWAALAGLDLVGQLYREGAHEDSRAHLGLRVDLPGHLDALDLAAGRNLSGPTDWSVTAGLGMTF